MTANLIAGTTVLGDVLLMHKYYAKFNSHLRAMTNNYDIYLKTCTKMYRFSHLMEVRSRLSAQAHACTQHVHDASVCWLLTCLLVRVTRHCRSAGA
jgi:hypothetical protein